MAVSASSQPPPSRARALDQRHRARRRAPARARRRWPGAARPCVTASPKPGRLDARQHGSEPVGPLRVPAPEVVVEVALVGEEEGGHDLATLGRPGTVAPMTGHRLLPGTDPRLRVAPVAGRRPRRPPHARAAVDPRRAAVHRAHRRPRRRRLHERRSPARSPAPTSSRSSRPGSRSTSGSTCSSAPSTHLPTGPRRRPAPGPPRRPGAGAGRRRRRLPAVLAARRPGPRRRARPPRPAPGSAWPPTRRRRGRSSATPSPAGPGRAGYLQRLAVHPDHQRAGLGGALVVDGLRWLRRWGAKEVLVNTQEGNEPAVRLYEALGFQLRPDGLGRPPPRPRRGAVVTAPRRRAGRAPRRRRSRCASAPPPPRRPRCPTPARRRASSWSSQTPVAAPGEPFVATVRLDGRPRRRQHRARRAPADPVAVRAGPVDGGRGAALLRVPHGHPAVGPARPARRHPTASCSPSTRPPAGCRCPPRACTRSSSPRRTPPATTLATLVTHLIVPPEDGDDAPNLAVAVVAELGAPLALQPDGAVDLDRRRRRRPRGRWSPGSTAAPDVPATLSIQPETVEALLASPEPGDAELVAALRARRRRPDGARRAVRRRSTSTPWRPPTCSARSSRSRRAATRSSPTRSASSPTAPCALAAPDPRRRWARACWPSPAPTGWSSTTSSLEPLADGIISYSLAQPFVVAVPEGADVDDRTPGPVLGAGARPDRHGAPHRRRVARAGGEPRARRAGAAPARAAERRPVVASSGSRPGCDAATVQQLLEAIGTGRPFEAVSLAGAFDHAAPVLDGGGNPVERALDPDDVDGDHRRRPPRSVAAGRADLDTFAALVGADSPLPDLPSRHLLVATGAGLDDDERRAQLDAAARRDGRRRRPGVDAADASRSPSPPARAPSRSRSGTTPACRCTCRST